MQIQFCEFDDLPTEEELEEAIFKMKKGKAAGKSGILPELLLLMVEVLYGLGC